jgi:hypothetical protein
LIAAQRKINNYRQQYTGNQNISFLPAIVSTSTRMHGELLRLLFLQAHRETEAHFNATGMPSQQHNSASFRFRHAAFYQNLKSKVGLAVAKAAALRIKLNIEGCGLVAPRMHAPSRAPLIPPLLLSHNLPFLRGLTDSENLCIGQYDNFFEEYHYQCYSFHHIGYSRCCRYLINLLRRLHQKAKNAKKIKQKMHSINAHTKSSSLNTSKMQKQMHTKNTKNARKNFKKHT